MASAKTTKKKTASKSPATKADKAEKPEKAAKAEKAATGKSAASKSKAVATEKAAEGKATKAKAATKSKAKAATKSKAKAATKSKAKAASTKSPAKAAKAKAHTGEGALLVVESPAKARTIQKYLGSGVEVMASVGHVKDLPKSKIGVDIEHDFVPEYVPIRGKGKVIAEIKKAARSADTVYLAPDPDREGEAIAWHIADEIRDANPNIKRVLFNEITKRGITEAMAQPTDLNRPMFDAQQARRILDRLVGYQISPILWTKVRRGLSAGRVQSVAVRICVEREAEITAFKSEEYWTVEAQVEGKSRPAFTLRLTRVDGQKPERLSAELAQSIAEFLKKTPLSVTNIESKVRRKMPAAPFITSKLQQEASRKLRFTAKRTMGVAQRLYEGVELGAEGLVGLITYMRTDSTRISPDALTEVRTFIEGRYGKASLPDEPNVYKSKSGSNVQDAHEAIRPTSTKYDPETVRRLLTEAAQRNPEKEKDIADQIKLYQLIWNRFVASQMTPAVYDQTTVYSEVKGAHNCELRATGQVLRMAGFTAVYSESQDEDQRPGGAEAGTDNDGEGVRLPPLEKGESLRTLGVQADQHFTQPPPRFTEASLIKELEEKGIGRPSTYATILSTIQDRGYVEKREGRFFPTLLGTRVNDLLVQSFPEVVSVDFTARMESDLDFIEEGKENWLELMKRFYGPFKGYLERAQIEMKDWKREEIPTEFSCEKCGKPLVIKWGRNGEFLACSGYPECKNTKEFVRGKDGRLELKPEPTTDEPCPKCGSPLVFRRGRFGEFWACSKYPDCKTTKPVSLGITCPRPGCGGFLTEKRSRRGTSFYGCSNYNTTHCDFVSWDRPVKEPCPDCGAPFLLQKQTRRGPKLRCATCSYVSEVDADDSPEDATGSTGGAEDEAEEGAA